MELDNIEQRENELKASIDWTAFNQSLDKVLVTYDREFCTFIGSDKTARPYSSEGLANALSEFIKSRPVDKEIKKIIKCLALNYDVFNVSPNREELISRLAFSIFETIKETIIQAKQAKDRAFLITKIIQFCSPTEMLVALMSQYSFSNTDLAKGICRELVKIVKLKYPVEYSQELEENEQFQVAAPFLRAMMFSEQMQVILIVANSIREHLIEDDPDLWYEIAPLFKMCISKQSREMNLNTLTEEDNIKISDSSIKDLFGNQGDIAVDASIDLASLPNVIFRRYQDRTVDRVSTEFLVLMREVTGVLPKLNDANSLSNMIRYVQDYLFQEIAGINANCFLFSEISERSFVELLVVTIDKIRDQVVSVSESPLESSCFDKLINYEILPEVLRDGNLVLYLEGNSPEILSRQIAVTRELISHSLVESTPENIFQVSLGFASPYRFITTLSWINWRDIENEVKFNREDDVLWGDPMFQPALMLSWVLLKEIVYNKFLVGGAFKG